jgi:hypothetical protein
MHITDHNREGLRETIEGWRDSAFHSPILNHIWQLLRVSSSGRSGKNVIGGSSTHLILLGRQFGNTYMTTSEKPSTCSLGKRRTCHVLPKKSTSWIAGTSTSTLILPGNFKDSRPQETLHIGPLLLQVLSS